jgi:P-type Ca2+ transporter type 2B
LNEDKYIVLTKGDSEIILERSTKYTGKNGEVKELDNSKMEEVNNEVIAKFANEAYRTLSIAFKEVPKDELEKKKADVDSDNEEEFEEYLETDLTLLAIVGIQDPLRDDIPEAVGRCKKSGITVRMITGDNITTAKAIAINAGILEKNEADQKYAVIDGKTFREAVGCLVEEQKGDSKTERVKNEEKFMEIVSQLRVLARSSLQDKYLLVTGLKNKGAIVAVTGDGTNDAPALKKADVGFAM